MAEIDPGKIQHFFANHGKKIYDNAYTTVKSCLMDDLIDTGVLLGLSGGADSVMLLLFLLEYRRQTRSKFNILAMHINHQIREGDADRDEEFCRSLCARLNVEFCSERIDIPAIASDKGVGIEEAARTARYNAFAEKISGRNDINCIAVAHNMGDSAETVIFNILRGCGAKGASGIRPVRDNIIRPLIRVAKSDIIAALHGFEIDYVTDITNFSSDYTRNYIRQEIMPAFSKICENPEKMLCRFADNLRKDDDYIEGVATKFLNEFNSPTNRDLLSLDYSVYIRVLSLMAKQKGASISSAIASDIYSNLQKDSFCYSLIGARFVCDRGVCCVCSENEPDFDFCVPVCDGKAHIDVLDADAFVCEKSLNEIYSNVYNFSIQANISSAIIKGRLYFRPKKDGDTVFYGGMTHKLKKLYNDKKISLTDRKKFPVLCDDIGVVWIPGFGARDDRAESKSKSDLFVFIGSDIHYSFLK